jgi:predicted dehydrogenase
MIRLGVIGYGYWGPNLVRNFAEAKGATVAAVSDSRPERLSLVSSRYPSVTTCTDPNAILNDSSIDAVVIATPVATHFDLARRALENGKHVLITKPLTDSVALAEELVELAAKKKRVLMLDHTFIYKGAVRTIKDFVSSGRLGKLYYYDSVRVNLGLFQHDVNVLWDLAVHDLSIMDYVLNMLPCAVSATGIAHVKGEPEDVAYLTCFFEQNLIAHFHVNWLAPVKVRKTLIGGDKQMIVYDDLEPDAPLKVFDKGIDLASREGIYQALVNYRTGDMWAPHVDPREALSAEAAHFIDCVANGARCETDGASGVRLVRVLEAANRSLATNGQPVELR